MVVIGRSAGQWYMIWISAQLIESEHEGIAVWVLHGVLQSVGADVHVHMSTAAVDDGGVVRHPGSSCVQGRNQARVASPSFPPAAAPAALGCLYSVSGSCDGWQLPSPTCRMCPVWWADPAQPRHAARRFPVHQYSVHMCLVPSTSQTTRQVPGTTSSSSSACYYLTLLVGRLGSIPNLLRST